jgi:RHS repeat-associated protein
MTSLSLGVIVAHAAVSAMESPSPSATAGKPDGTCGLCVLAPSGRSLSLTGNGSVSLGKGNVVVNSAGKPAVSLSGNGSLIAPSVGVLGTVSTGRGTIRNLTTGIAPIADPLAGLQAPSLPVPSQVPSVNLGGNDSRTISPGVYEEISVTGKGSLTLAAGSYVVRRRLSTKGDADLTAQGVTIYLSCSYYPTPCRSGEQGASLGLAGKGLLSLSGPTANCSPIAIFADRNSTAPISLTGDGSQALGGVIYARSGALTLAGNGSVVIGGFVVAGAVSATGNGNVSITQSFPLSEGLALSLSAAPTSGHIGETETLSSSLTCHGKPLAGRTLTFTVTGANPEHGTVKTDSAGAATFSYKGHALGTDKALASFTAPGIGVSSAPAGIDWSRAQPSISTSVSQGSVEQGKPVTDTAKVSGGFSPTGTVSWNVYAGGDSSCHTPLNSQPLTANLNNGTAQSPSYTPGSAGTHQFVATYDGDANNQAASTICGDKAEQVVVMPAAGISPISTTTVQGNFYAAEPSAQTFTAKPGDTPAFGQSFPTVDFNPPAGTIAHSLAGLPIVDPTTRPFTDLTTDQAGNGNGAIVAQGNGQQAGAGSLNSFDAALTANFVAAKAGDVTFSIVHDDGFLLGIGGGASRVSGTFENPPASSTTSFKEYPLLGAFNEPSAFGPKTDTVTVHFPKAGSYPYELDYFKTAGGSELTLVMTTGEPPAENTGAGGVFVTGHDPDFHAYQGSNQAGAQHIIQDAIAHVTRSRPNPKILLVTDLRNPGGGYSDPRAGLQAAGFTTFDVADYGSETPGVVNLNTVNFKNYDAVVIASDFGGWLRQEELNILDARAGDIERYVNSGGGLVAFAENSGASGGLTSEGDYGFLPCLAKVRLPASSGESGFTLTDTGRALGLLTSDVNGNAYHMIFTGNCGYELVDTDAGGNFISLTETGRPIKDGEPEPPPKLITTPLPPATTLTLTPSGHTSLDVNQQQIITASALDSGGHPVPNLPISLTVSGANSQHLSATTDATGVARFPPLVGVNPGDDAAEATATVDGQSTVSNAIAITWNIPIPGKEASEPSGGTPEEAPPLIADIGPADGTEVAKPVPVTALIKPPEKKTISSWKVTLRALDPEPATVLASGNGTPPSPLATLDPTKLPNGTYEITVSATASGGGTQTSSSTVAVHGNLKLGRYTTTYQDLVVPVNGFQMEVRRVYDSIDKRVGDFGVGWHVELANFRVSTNRELGAGGWSEYGTHCFGSLCLYAFKTSAPHYVTITFPDGHQEVFDFTPEGGSTLFSAATPKFTARPGTGTTSSLTAGGSLGLTATGDLVDETGNPYNPTRFTLTTRQGTVLVLDVDRGLESETDRNGNSLTVDASGVHSSGGQSITFTRDTEGRIAKITGPSGQVLAYGYAGEDLASSTDANGHETAYAYDSNHNLLEATGPGGQALQTLTYDSSGRLDSVTDANGNKTTISTNVNGRQQTETDPNGKLARIYTYDELGDVLQQAQVLEGKTTLTTKYTYDGLGRPTGRTDPLGNTWAAEYDGAGDLTKLTHPSGHSTTVTYDAFGDPLTVSDPLGNTASYAYDSRGDVTSVTDPLGHAKTYTYDGAGHIASIADRDGRKTSYTYDAAGHLASKTDPLGNKTTYAHDAAGNLTSVTDPLGHTTSYIYDEVGNRTSLVDPLGRKTTYSYDALNHLVSATDPAAHTSRWSYTGAGQLASSEDAAKSVTSYTYDADGNLAGTTDPRGAKTGYAYDGLGRLTERTDPLGRATRLTWDGAGNLTAATDPAGHTTHFDYDDEGRITSSTDPLGNTTTYAFDANGNLTSVTDPLGHLTSYTYDAAGRPVSSTDPAAHKTTYAFDPQGLLSSVSDALGGTIKFAYDGDGNQVGLTEPDGNTTSYAHDAAGNLTKVTDPLGRMTTHTYDQANQLTSTTDGRGIAATYAYDSAGELASAVVPGESVSYTYDALGRRTSMNDGTGTTSYGYDPASDITSVASPRGAISYTYDLAGQRQTMTLPGSRQVSYAYDAASNLTSLEDWLGKTSTYGYDADGRPTAIDRPNGVNTSLTYDAAGQVLSLNHDGSGGPIAHNAYTYDAAGNRASTTSAAGTESFNFDALNRLTKAAYPNGDVAVYTYDPAGNRTSSTFNGTTTKASYDAAGELTANGATGYTYDGDGDLLSAGSSRFSWDPLGRLASAAVGGETSSYAYDGDGLRNGATRGATTTPYLWDIQGGLPQLVDDGTNGYVQAGGLQEQINRSTNTPAFALADALGSIQTLTGAAGNVTGSTAYDAFGNTRSHTGEATIFGYAGQQTDPTGLQYLRARYLDPSIGRFISPDSIQPSGPGTQGYNRCAYVQNDPTTFTDPSGHLLAEYAPLLPEQIKRGEALGSINRCLGVALMRGLRGETAQAESLVGKAFDHFKDVVPFAGIAEQKKVSVNELREAGLTYGPGLIDLYAPQRPGKVVTLPSPGFDPEIQKLSRDPWGAPEKPRLGDNLGAQINPTIIPDNRPTVWDRLSKFLGYAEDAELGIGAYGYFSELAKLQCEPNEPSGEQSEASVEGTSTGAVGAMELVSRGG